VAGIPGDGPYMLLWFEVVQGVIVRASYDTYGCPAAVACGSMTAEVLIGRTPEQALLLQPHDLILLLCGIPEGRAHCPQLAIEALKNAFREEGE
jgi:nitrogen fixation NifU-like protein